MRDQCVARRTVESENSERQDKGQSPFGRAIPRQLNTQEQKPREHQTEPYEAAIHNLALIYQRKKLWAQLEPLLAEASKRFPTEPKYPVFEAKMWLERDSSAKAIEALEVALKINTNYAPAISLYVETLIETDQHEKTKTIEQHLSLKNG